jgi:hypothetical protein
MHLLTEFEREDVQQMRFSPSEHLVAVAYGTNIDVFSSHTWTLLATLKVPFVVFYLSSYLNSCFGESFDGGRVRGPRASSPRVLSQKYFSHPSLVIYFFFCNTTHKTETNRDSKNRVGDY